MPNELDPGKYYLPFTVVPEDQQKFYQLYIKDNLIDVNTILEPAAIHKYSELPNIWPINFDTYFKSTIYPKDYCGLITTDLDFKTLKIDEHYIHPNTYENIVLSGTFPRTGIHFPVNETLDWHDFGLLCKNKIVSHNTDCPVYYNSESLTRNGYFVYNTISIGIYKNSDTQEFDLVVSQIYYNYNSSGWWGPDEIRHVYNAEYFKNRGFAPIIPRRFTLIIGAGGGGGYDSGETVRFIYGRAGGGSGTIALKIDLTKDNSTIFIFLGREGMRRSHNGPAIINGQHGLDTYVTTDLDILASEYPYIYRFKDLPHMATDPYQEAPHIGYIDEKGQVHSLLYELGQSTLNPDTTVHPTNKDIIALITQNKINGIRIGCGTNATSTTTGTGGTIDLKGSKSKLFTDFCIGNKSGSQYIVTKNGYDGGKPSAEPGVYPSVQKMPKVTFNNLPQDSLVILQSEHQTRGRSETDDVPYGGCNGLFANLGRGGKGGISWDIDNTESESGYPGFVALLY